MALEPVSLNPYIAGSPVTDAKMFFGREDIFDWIEHSLAGQYADHILVIHGQRRVGKTSVLKQLPHRLPNRYIPVFFDLQGRTRTTLDRFLWWLAREIVRVLKQDRELILPLPEKETFSTDPEHLEGHFLPDLRRLLPDHNLLLTFDEFDTLEEDEVRDTLGRPLTETLRRLMGREGLNFIFSIGSSGRKLENMQASYTEFFKAALYKKVSFLDQGQTHSLITRPVEGVLDYQPAAVRAIFEITSGHPYFTQLICHELFALCQRSGQHVITQPDVLGVMGDVVERGTVNLKFVWDEASDLEKWSLAGLAHAEAALDSRALGEVLRKQRVRFSPPDLEAALLHLREKDVLTAQNAFVNQLLRLWLQRNRPLEQVREELTEVNPIANRYIEIGLEYLESGLHEKAVQSFQEALGVDADNLPALVHIGQVHLQRQGYAEAVGQFEQALALDEEDVSARAGLCQAHLALGDQALARGKAKDAQRSFQKILAINPEHTDARQRMADIYLQQAEKALAEKKDEEALGAFRQALMFTPEDHGLEARVREVEEQKRAVVLAMLRARAELAMREQRWEQAIIALDEALLMQPDDPDLLGKVATARSGQRESQLAGARAQAARMTSAERWEDALRAWAEYLALEPEDREAAQDEVAQVEKARSVAQSYAQAQAALASRDFDRAVSLLKAIVVEDEGYKDASRLMAEAIELRRARRGFWQGKWVRSGIAGALLLGLAGLFAWAWPRLTAPAPAALAPTQPESIRPTAAPTQASRSVAASPTSLPTPTSIPLAWSRLSSGQFLPRDRVNAIVIDPSDPGLLYVGTENAGVYKSIDGGLSWQPAQNGLGGSRIAGLVIDPQNPSVLYAGVSNAAGAVYKTSDRGASWQISLACEGSPGRYCDPQIAVDLTVGGHVYAAVWETLYETVDGGERWTKLKSSACPEFGEIAVDSTDGTALYAIGWTSDACNTGGLFRSEDGGRTWKISGLERSDIGRLMVGPGPEERIYVWSEDGWSLLSLDGGANWGQLPFQYLELIGFGSNGAGFAVSGDTLWKSTDGGQTWQDLGRVTLTGIQHLAVSPDDPEMIFAAGNGVSASADGGISWVERNAGLPATGVELKVVPSAASTLFIHRMGQWLDQCGELQRSLDGGENWTAVSNQGCRLLFDADGLTIYRFDSQTLYRSSDLGETWASMPLTFQADRLATHPGRERFLFGFPWAGESVMTSTDGGESWQPLSDQAVEWMQSVSLFFEAGTAEVAYLVPHYGAYRSEDGGTTWEACNFDIAWTSLTDSRWEIDPRNSRHIYVARLDPGLWTSTDGCRDWKQVIGFPAVMVNSLAISPPRPDTIYAGTEAGAYISLDAGQTWGAINDGLLGATVVYSIVVDPQGQVYAATPYGIFRLEAR